MSLDDNKAIVRRYRELHNANNYAAFDTVLATSFVAHDMMPQVPQTPDGARQVHRSIVAMFPDSHTRTDDLIAEGDRVVERWTFYGTHTGAPFFVGNVPASGKKVEYTGTSTYRIANGKIVETWGNMDSALLLQQLGISQSQRIQQPATGKLAQ